MQRWIYATILSFLATCAQEEPASKPAVSAPTPKTAQQALSKFNVVVGDWRGVGQPKRSSNRGAWSEQGTWKWDLTNRKAPALTMTSPKGKLIRQLWLRYDETKQQYALETHFADTDKPTSFTPVAQANTPANPRPKRENPKDNKPAAEAMPSKLVFIEANAATPRQTRRMTLQLLRRNRMTILVERGESNFRRVGGIGYTRKGESIAGGGSRQPECVVTGGTGTIKVPHKGKTYFVCCSGCQQAFDANPEEIIADYRARIAQEKKSAKKKRTDDK